VYLSIKPHCGAICKAAVFRIHGLFPVEGDQKTKTGKKKLPYHLGHHKELEQEATSRKHMFSMNT
jgi:hypothetical protein